MKNAKLTTARKGNSYLLKKWGTKSYLLFLLTILVFPFQGNTQVVVGTPNEHVEECCIRENAVCSRLSQVTIGTIYEYTMRIRLVSGPNPAELTNIFVIPTNPLFVGLPVSDEEFRDINGNGITFPYTLTPNSTEVFEINFNVVLAPTTVVPGTYEMTVRVEGREFTPKILNFSLLTTLFHTLTDECVDPVGLVESNDSERISVSPTLASKWHPNPTQNSAILEMNLDRDSKAQVEIMDMQGRILLRPILDQNLKSGINRRKLDVSGLAAGIYYTRITTETETQVIKWVKLE